MNKYNITPKETTYNGVEFRSLLEAKWACFFDITGWQWQYEPMQINGRVPDFIIYTKSDSYPTNKIIVEVKPSTMIDDKFKRDLLNSYKNEQCHLLILDENPFYFDDTDMLRLGLMSQYYGWEDEFHSEIYAAHMKCKNDFGTDYMIWDGIVYGEVYRKNFICKHYGMDNFLTENIISNWREAQNRVKFKSY